MKARLLQEIQDLKHKEIYSLMESLSELNSFGKIFGDEGDSHKRAHTAILSSDS
jgi:hypothetical protein